MNTLTEIDEHERKELGLEVAERCIRTMLVSDLIREFPQLETRIDELVAEAAKLWLEKERLL